MIIFLIVVLKYRNKKKLVKLTVGRKQRQFISEINHLGISNTELDLLERLSSGTTPEILLPIIQSNEMFESKVAQAKEAKKLSSDDLTDLQSLRHRLEFSFSNHEVPFLNTRMLQSGQKLQAVLQKGERTLRFESEVLETNEMYLMIKPPVFKGKPKNIRQFTEIICQLQRKQDSVYESIFKIVDQKKEAPYGAVLEQTDKIRKIRDLTLVREDEMTDIEDWIDSIVRDQTPSAKQTENEGVTK